MGNGSLLSHVASPTSKFTIPKDMLNLSCVFRDLWKMLRISSGVPISLGSLKAQKRFKGEKESQGDKNGYPGGLTSLSILFLEIGMVS